VERRENSDVNSVRLEGALFGELFRGDPRPTSRAYLLPVGTSLPGATIFYNTGNFSQQRLWDRNFFLQGSIEHAFSRRWVLQGNAKYNRSYLRYLDPTYLGAEGKYEDIFNQQETYGSLSLLYRAFERLSFSASGDLSSATMEADRTGFLTPTRPYLTIGRCR